MGVVGMLVMPIINGDNVINLVVSFAEDQCKKEKANVNFGKIPPSQVIVNRKGFLGSTFSEVGGSKAVVDFIRAFSILHSKVIYIITARNTNAYSYDIYSVKPLPNKICDELDTLYGYLINDIRKRIPENLARGKYLSLKKCGFGECFSVAKLAKIKRIVETYDDEAIRSQMFEKEGVSEMVAIAEEIAKLRIERAEGEPLPIESLEKVKATFSIINTRDSRNLEKYHSIAKTNTDILGGIFYVYEKVHGESFVRGREFFKSRGETSGETGYMAA